MGRANGAERLEEWSIERRETGRQGGRDDGAESAARRGAKVLTRALRPLRWSEALELPGRWIAELPCPPALALRVPGVPGLVRVDVAGRCPARPDEVVLDAEEWRSVVLGVEADRLWRADFVGLCARKRSDPSWRIGAEVALAGAQPDPEERWSTARVLARLEAEVLEIELHAA